MQYMSTFLTPVTRHYNVKATPSIAVMKVQASIMLESWHVSDNARNIKKDQLPP